MTTDVADLSGLSGYDLVSHLERQRAFSERTFGPGRVGPPDARERGLLDHIRKELDEIARDPDDLEEWIDVAILAFDGAWRTGASPEQIAEALARKLAKNERRVWPDWRSAAPGKAIEHVRETLFACRACAISATRGWTDGSTEEAGWFELQNIDGPCHVCPRCAADPDRVLCSFRDEFTNVALKPVPSRLGPAADPAEFVSKPRALGPTEHQLADALCGKLAADRHRRAIGTVPERHDLVADLAAAMRAKPTPVVAAPAPTAATLIELLAGLPDRGDGLLRELLRADPDRAVRVVDDARIARRWSEDNDRSPLNGGPFVGVIEVFPATVGAPWPMVEWDARDENGDTIADGTCSSTSAVEDAQAALDAALVEDGWVLAGKLS